MRSSNIVTKTNRLVDVVAQAVVVAKRNVAKLPRSLARLHLAMRRHYAPVGYSSFLFGTMQPAPATAISAEATSRRDRWGCPTSRPSTRHG
jgi:hypothetical protein